MLYIFIQTTILLNLVIFSNICCLILTKPLLIVNVSKLSPVSNKTLFNVTIILELFESNDRVIVISGNDITPTL